MNNFRDIALGIISRNPQVANNPQAQGYIDAIKSGDNNKMREIAMNICNTYGMTPEQAANSAIQFFGASR